MFKCIRRRSKPGSSKLRSNYSRLRGTTKLIRLCHRTEIGYNATAKRHCNADRTTCLIRVEPHVLESLDPPTDAERELLDFLGVLGGNYRLGCQIELTKGLEYATISVAEDRNS